MNKFSFDVSVVIVNWNTCEMLKNCLYSIRKCTNIRKVQIIVVDNLSSDGSCEMLQTLFPEVLVINSGGNLGFGRANNLAIPYTEAPLIIFLNPDTIIINDAIKLMIEFINKNPQVGALGCKCINTTEQSSNLNIDDKVQPLGLQWFPTPFNELLSLLFLSDKTIKKFKHFLPYKDPNTNGYVLKLYGACYMVRRKILDQIGYFDDRYFMYVEDVDLSRRITDAGWKLYYLSDAVIIHIGSAASINVYNQFSTLMMCESATKYIHKYHGFFGSILYRAVLVGGSLYRLLILLILKTISTLSLSHGRSNNYGESVNKYKTMIKWALYLQKPIIKN